MEAPPVIDTTPAVRTNTFPKQLRFWGIHCGLTALPSFCIAITTFNGPSAILAMLCGIATFVFSYALITATPLYGKVHTGLIGRSIKLGTRIRMIISLASLPLLLPLIGTGFNDSAPPESLFFAPDFWFGYAAIMISFLILNAISPQGSLGSGPETWADTFLLPYFTTVIEGILISVSLVFIAFITLIILNFRRNRRQLPSQHIPPGPPV